MKFLLLESGPKSIHLIVFILYLSCHVLEMANKTNDANGLLITLQFN